MSSSSGRESPAARAASRRVWLVHRRMLHHSPHSGYDRIADYVPEARRLPRLPLGPAAGMFDRVFRRWAAPRCPLEYYRSDCLRDELTLLLHARRGVYHYLYGEDQFWLVGRWGGGRGQKLIATFHQPPTMLRRVIRSTEHLRGLDAAVIVGTNQRSYFEPLVGDASVHFVPHGVDVDFFRPASRSSRPRRPQCLFAGAWLRDFSLLRSVVDDLRASPVEFVVVTDVENHHYLASCANVRLLSGISEAELLNLYQTSDLVVLPMLDATANNVLLEAMACGTPAVVTDVGGIRDYADESCAVLVPRGDAGAFSSAVHELLDDDARRARLGEAARTCAERFDWRVVAQRMTEVYAAV